MKLNGTLHCYPQKLRSFTARADATSHVHKSKSRNLRSGWLVQNDFYVRAAGRLAAWSRIVSSTLLGTCSKMNGSIEYDARPFDSERMAVA